MQSVFKSKTYSAVRQYQARKGLVVDGIIGNNTWRALMTDVVGRGRTSTTID